MQKYNRRNFIKTSALATGAVAFSAKSYGRIIGANSKLNMAVAGLNGRGKSHLSMASAMKNEVRVTTLIDPDSRVFAPAINEYNDVVDNSCAQIDDFRIAINNNDIDILTIAAPDHWHAPMAIAAMKAGKHVYLEKPCSHNPQEGEWLKQSVKKYGKVLQIGNQQRSSPTTASLLKELNNGIIGNVYYAKAYYTANRGSIGKGKVVKPPKELNWTLWQGPSPHKPYQDIWVHYNWHWFWHWGTGEICNNGLHEIDVARRILKVGVPQKVSSAGGRYAWQDDWEFYDTQIASYEFADGKLLNWEGRSCNPTDLSQFKGGRGVWFYGTEGSGHVDRGAYTLFDKKGKIIKTETEKDSKNSVDTLGISGLDNYHFNNFINAIKKGEALNSPIDEATISTNMCHFGNMAQKLGKVINIDPNTGKPTDAQALKYWGRTYENSWKPAF